MKRASVVAGLCIGVLVASCGTSSKSPSGNGTGGTASGSGGAGNASGSGGSGTGAGNGGESATGGTEAGGGQDGASSGSAGVGESGASGATAGTSGSTSGGSAGEAGNAGRQACEDYAEAHCARWLACFALDFKTTYASLEQCVARTSQFCPDELTAPGGGVTVESLAACAEALAEADCSGGAARPIPACAFSGTVAPGSACRYDSQCASGFCNRPVRSWCGVCEAQVGVDGECNPNRPNGCEEGLRCSTTNRCVEPQAAGASCASNAECAVGLICSSAEPRTCVPAAGPGESCRSLVDCDTTEELYCTSEEPACELATLAPAGAACDAAAGTFCAGGGVCRGEDGVAAAAGECSPPTPDGDTCDLDTGAACLAPALCIDGVCTAPASAAGCR